MDQFPSLQGHLAAYAGLDPLRGAVADTVAAIAACAVDIARLIAERMPDMAEPAHHHPDRVGDAQHPIDVRVHRLLRAALADAPVAAMASEERESLDWLNEHAPLAVALDPIDGSGNVELNMPTGTIFSIVRAPERPRTASEAFAWAGGDDQLAAGFFVYGAQTMLVLTLEAGVDLFVLDRGGVFRLARAGLRIPAEAPAEYAVNASNYRHWREPVRAFIDECIAGADGPYGRDFNTRWHGALVAECLRILLRGGSYLYPADSRPGYGEGRLRLLYEGYPMALLVERAGGAASDGRGRLLDLPPRALHARVPLMLGPPAVIARLEQLHRRPGLWPDAPTPLFATRGLFRV